MKRTIAGLIAAAGLVLGAVTTAAPAAIAAPVPHLVPAESCPINVASFSEWRLVHYRHQYPSGPGWKVYGHVRITLKCDIIKGDVELRLQRHVLVGRHPVRYEWTTFDKEYRDLGGDKKGAHISLVVSYDCTGKADWRLRFFGSPGLAGDHHGIAPQILYFPNADGKELDCR